MFFFFFFLKWNKNKSNPHYWFTGHFILWAQILSLKYINCQNLTCIDSYSKLNLKYPENNFNYWKKIKSQFARYPTVMLNFVIWLPFNIKHNIFHREVKLCMHIWKIRMFPLFKNILCYHFVLSLLRNDIAKNYCVCLYMS